MVARMEACTTVHTTEGRTVLAMDRMEDMEVHMEVGCMVAVCMEGEEEGCMAVVCMEEATG